MNLMDQLQEFKYLLFPDIKMDFPEFKSRPMELVLKV